jgi:hypothetical protein
MHWGYDAHPLDEKEVERNKTLFGSYWRQLFANPPAAMQHTEFISWEKESESESPVPSGGDNSKLSCYPVFDG